MPKTSKHGFTVKKSLMLEKEDGGVTRRSLENARAIAGAGYELYSGHYSFNPSYGDYKLTCTFGRGEERAEWAFTGLGIGYSGEGPRGLIEFGEIFGLEFNKEKILTPGIYKQETEMELDELWASK